MDPKEMFAKAVQQATSCIRHVKDDQLKNATPCKEWDLKALLNHMVYELLWVPELIRGKTVAEVGERFDGDVLRTDYKAAWQHAADSALLAINHAEPEAIVHLSYADKPAKDYAMEVGTDIFIHTWDVDQAMNCTLILNEGIAKIIYDELLPHKSKLAETGAYAKAVEVDKNAHLQEKLLALTGRSSQWRQDK